jgi:hypothetical protein
VKKRTLAMPIGDADSAMSSWCFCEGLQTGDAKCCIAWSVSHCDEGDVLQAHSMMDRSRRAVLCCSRCLIDVDDGDWGLQRQRW